MKKSVYFIKTLFKIIITILVTFLITVIWLYGSGKLLVGSAKQESTVEKDSISAKIETIKALINQKALNELDENLAKEYMIKGYVASLGDIYAAYYSADEMKALTEETIGSFYGIGVYMYLDTVNDCVVVYDTMDNTPADEAGIKSGDIIKSVDGEEFNGNNYENISNKIKGKEGSKVKLVILRNDEEIEFELTRKKIETTSVSFEMLKDNIGYIRIESFDGNVYNQFKDAYTELLDKGMSSLVLDIRSNSGGVVQEATKVADMFVDKGTVILKEIDKNEQEIVTTAKEDKTIKMNTVVLINGSTASASEILTGCLKLNADNVKIMGTKTYGKGVIQNIITFTDGSGLKITTEKYKLSNNEEIDKVGIEPDEEVKYERYNKKVLDKENDTQLIKAIEELSSK